MPPCFAHSAHSQTPGRKSSFSRHSTASRELGRKRWKLESLLLCHLLSRARRFCRRAKSDFKKLKEPSESHPLLLHTDHLRTLT